MTQMLKSIADFKSLWPTVAGRGFGLFFGAGISRDEPTNGPIWTEMQTGFMSAIFDRMKNANWSISERFPDDRKIVDGLDIRPEVFWREMIGICGQGVIGKALEAVDIGPPNGNHDTIAAMLVDGRCKVAMTTNFDEHVESLLSEDVTIRLPSNEHELPPFDRSIYVKLHGTVSNSDSLAYTLEHYDKLTDRNLAICKTLSGYPLIIAGYSGYDTDVLPALYDAAKTAKCVIIIHHPGSSHDQPVLKIAANNTAAYILEAPCSDVLSILSDGLRERGYRSVAARRNGSRSSLYEAAVGQIPLLLCPVVLMSALKLAGYWGMTRTHAFLTHDACCDAQNRGDCSSDEIRRIKSIYLMLAYTLRLAGDTVGSRIMMGEAKLLWDGFEGGAAEAHAFLEAAALMQNASDQGSSDIYETAPTLVGSNPIDFFEGSLALQTMFNYGELPSNKETFEKYWSLGIARKRAKDTSGAIQAFEASATYVFKDFVTHLERGQFFLDYGSALYEHCIKTRSEEIQKQAYILYFQSEKITREIGDWATNARALFMIAKLVYIADDKDQARAYLRSAIESGSRTGDSALMHRMREFEKIVNEQS